MSTPSSPLLSTRAAVIAFAVVEAIVLAWMLFPRR
jgi:hypothetical protein